MINNYHADMSFSVPPIGHVSIVNRNMESTLVRNARLRHQRLESPAIMESIENPSLIMTKTCEDTLDRLSPRLMSLNLNEDPGDNNGNSFLLLDALERLKVSTSEQFMERIHIPDNMTKVKVVSIFGNTGDGKSHTLNHTFFEGNEVFKTSSEQNSCTLGVWAAFDINLKVICLDTEGLLGATTNENQRTRLLLKVLAVSDVVIYRTRSERLHRDMFTFLGSASKAYTQHFQGALQAVGLRGDFGGSLSALGPAIVVFHETRNTKTLQSSVSESPEDILRERFASMRLEIEAFSSLKYIGVQTHTPPTSFTELRNAVQLELENTSVRSARHPHVVFRTLKALNDKFSGEIVNTVPLLFPDQYFTCPVKCQSCDSGCQKSMGHIREGIPHHNSSRCRYQHQYENCVYLCKACHANGREVIVTSRVQTSAENSWYGLAKYAWSGYVIECPNCGEIYRSRQYWYGNKNPEDVAVRTEIIHVWPGSKNFTNAQNSAQKVLDGVSYLSEAVASVGAHPTKMLSSWVADKVAPTYWRPNNEIKHCHACKKTFINSETKHHCRACGEGFCDECSSRSQPVPSRGWFEDVRVCDSCYQPTPPSLSQSIDDKEIRVRKYSEAVVNTLSSVASVLEYPKSFIKETARPAYWVPDADVTECMCCDLPFGVSNLLHHCRECGKAVCSDCSTTRKPVPLRGWDNPVRVCDKCVKEE